MKKFLIALTSLFIFTNTSFALEIVYPKKQVVTINSASTFFIGNATPTKKLTINNYEAKPVLDGGFAYKVPLNYGENVFIIKSGKETLVYKITRPKTETNNTPSTLREFEEVSYRVTKDNSTLRSTPIDEGINRLSQLPADTKIILNGEKRPFYRVKLGDNEYGWINKKDVLPELEDDFSKASVKQLVHYKDREFIYNRFKISKKVPFSVLNQNDTIVLKFHNTKDDDTYIYNNPLGYEYYWDIFGHFVLKTRYNIPTKPTIVIDAGHGGFENGAIGCLGDKEKDINLNIAKYLQKELEKDFKVVMTRDDDVQVTLQKRVDIAKENNALISVSIHANALPDGQDPNLHRGTSVYYYHKQAKPLADNILQEVTQQTGTNNDGVRQKSLALVRPTNALSVLVEVAYMINPNDNTMLRNCDFQQAVAKAVADGIRNYYCDKK